MKRILIVDDDPAVRQLLDAMLTLAYPRLQVVQAANGQEAIATTLAHHPDLILLDGHMPVLDGCRTAQALRSMPATQTIPLVVISGEPWSSETATRLRALCDACLPKPFSLDELVETVDQVAAVRATGAVAGRPD